MADIGQRMTYKGKTYIALLAIKDIKMNFMFMDCGL